MKKIILVIILFLGGVASAQRIRDYGIETGVLKPGKLNAITDVEGVHVGQVTMIKGENIRTGVTAILPHSGNIFQDKVPAAIYIGNGFGKLTGYVQVEELGYIETPVVLTNTLSVPAASAAVIEYTLSCKGNETVMSVNPVVGETNDGYLNDIRARSVGENEVLDAIRAARPGPVEEGNVGAGTGTVCFGFKGGIGTSSRILPSTLGRYTIGVLAQTNFGGVLEIAGVPVGRLLGKYAFKNQVEGNPDGSCMIVVATDAPLDARNLKRLAKRALFGMAKTGGIASDGSGDFVIAFSTAHENFESFTSDSQTSTKKYLRNDRTSPLFLAVIEATEEAILNSLFAAVTMEGRDGHRAESLPKNEIIELIKDYNRNSD